MGRKQLMQIESTEPSFSARWANASAGEIVVRKLALPLAGIWNPLYSRARGEPLYETPTAPLYSDKASAPASWVSV